VGREPLQKKIKDASKKLGGKQEKRGDKEKSQVKIEKDLGGRIFD